MTQYETTAVRWWKEHDVILPGHAVEIARYRGEH